MDSNKKIKSNYLLPKSDVPETYILKDQMCKVR